MSACRPSHVMSSLAWLTGRWFTICTPPNYRPPDDGFSDSSAACGPYELRSIPTAIARWNCCCLGGGHYLLSACHFRPSVWNPQRSRHVLPCQPKLCKRRSEERRVGKECRS